MKKSVVLLILLAVAGASWGGADPNAGTASFAFLKIGAGARPVALGGAYVGVAEGANGLYWNPGALTRMPGREFSATYMNYLVGMQSGYVAYAQPLTYASVEPKQKVGSVPTTTRFGVALLDLEPQVVSSATASVISEQVRGALQTSGRFNLVEKNRMEEILKEKAFQQTGVTELKRVVEAGTILNVDKMIYGTLGMLGKKYVLTLRVVDVKTAKVEYWSDEKREVGEKDLDKLVPPLVARIVTKVTTGKEPESQGVSTEEKRVRSSFGVSVNYLNGGQVQETTLDNPTGVGLPKFSPGDIALEWAYAQALSPSLSLGAGVKMVRETIRNYSAMGFALDLGAFYQPHIKGLTLGASLSNVGKKTKAFISEKEPLPMVFRAGLGYRIPRFKDKVLLALEADKPSDNKFDLHLGGEVGIHKYASLRAGYASTGGDLRTGSDTDWLGGLSFGLGTHYKSYQMDYAFTPYVQLGNAHRVSLSARF